MDPANEIASSLSGEHIAKMLRTDGPTVSCVLLHSCHPTPSENSDSNKPDQDVDKSDAKLSSSLSASLPSSSLSSSVIEKEDDATADADAGTKSVDAQERGSTGVDNGDKDHLSSRGPDRPHHRNQNRYNAQEANGCAYPWRSLHFFWVSMRMRGLSSLFVGRRD